MRPKWFVFLGLTGVISALPVACMLKHVIPTNHFTLTNQSGQFIRELTIVVCNTTFQFQNIPPDGTVSGNYVTPDDESMCTFKGVFQDGSIIDDSGGYVVWEFGCQSYEFSVECDGVVKEQFKHIRQ